VRSADVPLDMLVRWRWCRLTSMTSSRSTTSTVIPRDHALEAVARAFSEQARAGDVVARVGGDEFAVIAPDTDAIAAQRLGERLRPAATDALVAARLQLAYAALQTLAGPGREPGGEALSALLERHHETEAARYLEAWLQQAPRD
jgi:hypothetical protein